MQAEAHKWKAIATELAEQLAALQVEYDKVFAQKQHLMNQLFGRKSEKRDPNQLELLPGFGETDSTPAEQSTEPPSDSPVRPRKCRTRKPRIPENLPIDEEQVLVPDEVQADPDRYRRIGEEITDELDMTPPAIFVAG